MTVHHPSHFHPELNDERLRQIAGPMLDIRYKTMQEMASPYDDNYTRETAIFGRTRNMLIGMALSEAYPWMTLTNSGMDVTFNIGGVPCRFFRDDPDNPEKEGFFKRNATDRLFDDDEKAPVIWRFVVEKASTEEDEDQLYFIGYNVFHEKVAQWIYRSPTSMMHTVDREVPPAANIPPAAVDLREDSAAEEEKNSRSGNA